MNRSFPFPAPVVALLMASALVADCGGASGDGEGASVGDVLEDEVGGPADAEGAEPRDALPNVPDDVATAPVGVITVPAALAALGDDPVRGDRVPEVVDLETVADSGMQVAYTDRSQRARIAPSRVALQWQYMQTCLEVVAAAPLVLIRLDVEPFTDGDDVLRDLEGRIVASASTFADGSAILQVRDAPFDGSGPDAGFGPMRQIMGRHLWLSAGLLERFYPAECARTAPSDADATRAPGTPLAGD